MAEFNSGSVRCGLKCLGARRRTSGTSGDVYRSYHSGLSGLTDRRFAESGPPSRRSSQRRCGPSPAESAPRHLTRASNTSRFGGASAATMHGTAWLACTKTMAPRRASGIGATPSSPRIRTMRWAVRWPRSSASAPATSGGVRTSTTTTTDGLPRSVGPRRCLMRS